MIKKGLVFYYDWLDQLLKLSDDDLRVVLTAIILYHKEGIEPPELSGLADMALGFILPQIDRMKKKVEDGKLGGRPRKENASSTATDCESSAPKSELPKYKSNREKVQAEMDNKLLLSTIEKKRKAGVAPEVLEWMYGSLAEK